jgi:uncharacterized membrane protein YedE/YeeE
MQLLSSLGAVVARMGAASLLAAPFFVSRAHAAPAAASSSAGSAFLGLALQNFTPYHALAGGLLLGVAAAMSMIVKGEILGISGITGGIVKGKHAEMNRWIFVAGLLSGGVALKTLYPSALGTVDAPMWRLAVAGALVGAGSTLGNGCTSGHGICGNARLSVRSMIYTLIFMGTGLVTASLTKSGSTVVFSSSPTPSLDEVSPLAGKILAAHLLAYVAVTSLGTARTITSEMTTSIVTYLDGTLFALGLGLSGMTSPSKVAQFLDISAGSWDPSLMFVMGGALALNLPFMQGVILAGRVKKPMFSAKFSLPSRKDLDSRLIVGGILFGAGWGFGGACPGPAIVSLGSPTPIMLAWNAAFVAGIMFASRLFP